MYKKPFQYGRPMRGPIKGYPKDFFAVLVEWYHIVLTMSFKLVSFLYLLI